MRKTENIINRTGINKTECKKTGHSKENKIPGVKCTPKIELYLSNFKGALHWWNGSLFFLIIILGITLGVFAGCKNIFVPEPPATPEAAGPGGGITVSLRLFTGSARSVMPGMEALIWEITASQGDDTIEATGTYPTYTLELPVTGNWIFEVQGKNDDGEEIFTGDTKMEITGSTTSISIPLSPGSGMTAGTGQINLTLKVPDTVETVMYKLDSDSEFTVLALTDSSCILNKADVSAVIHTLSLYFLDGNGTTVYMCTETVNVWNGVTSNQWVKTSEADHINGNGEFELTKGIIDNFLKTMGSVVYVDASVDANTPATGSIYAPVKTVSKAVDILREANPDGNYSGTIMVSEATTIEDEIEVKNGQTLTIKGTGTGASITNGKGRVFNITSGGSLTLEENITLTGTNDTGNGGAVYVNGGSFTMEDGSKITGSSASFGGGVYVDDKGTFTMDGGTISKNDASGDGASGGGVCISDGTFTMSGGAVISKNSAGSSGGGVFVSDSGDFIMEGGTIGGPEAESANSAENGGGVYIYDGTFTMCDRAVISGNNASSSSGGGVYIHNGTFTMSDSAVISGNSATSSGGGVYVYETGNFTMEGGTIGGTGVASPNSSESGGGVCVYKGYFTMSDGYIRRNTATVSGGGVYVDGTSSTFFMHDNGTITNNNANLGGGVYVGDGTFTMNGGTLSRNIATQNGGGVCVDGTSSFFFMQGNGTITNNNANLGGGVYVSETGTFTLGSLSAESSPVISGNTKTASSHNNVYLDNTYLVIGGKLAEASGNVGITMATPGEEFTYGWDSSGSTEPTFFFSDDTKRTVALSGSELSLNLVRVEGGSCTLNNKEVTLSSFWISPYEVTQEEFKTIMTGNQNGIDPNPSEYQGDTKPPAAGEVQERRPVEQVSWYEAIVYCNLLSMREGLTPCYTIKGSTNPAAWGTSPTSKDVDWDGVIWDFKANGYRLPTEAEWEYAARGGQTGIIDNSWDYDYSGSDTIKDVAWYGGDSGNSDSKTHEVGKKDANALGLYDMSGNAGEWCWDWRSENYPSNPENPAGPESGEKRVRRGGSINNTPEICNVGNQNSADPWQKGFCFGFRVVRSIR